MNKKIRIDLYSKNQIQKAIIVLGIITTTFSLFGPNPGLCIPAFLSLYMIFSLLFVSAWINVFSIAFLYQWVQVSLKVLYGVYSFTDLRSLALFPEHIVLAYLLSSLALVCIAGGMHISISKIKIDNRELINDILAFDIRKVLLFYIGLTLSLSAFTYILKLLPGLFQIYVVFAEFKWICFFLFFVLCYKTDKYKGVLWSIILYEFLNGFSAFFASWKTILFYVLISWLAVKKITIKQMFILAFLLLIMIYLGLLWTGVKGEQRTFISQGEAQSINVSKKDAFTNLIGLIDNFSIKGNIEIQKAFLDRISYIDYFSSCLSYVPSKMPHENGGLTINSFKHMFMPRAFFPDKGVIDDSAHLTKYTGVFYSNYEMGVAFGLGYVPDFYVDYGAILMFPMLFLYGYFVGLIFLNLYNHAGSILWRISMMSISFFLLFKFENSMIKLFGQIITAWIFYRIFEHFILPQIDKYLRK